MRREGGSDRTYSSAWKILRYFHLKRDQKETKKFLAPCKTKLVKSGIASFGCPSARFEVILVFFFLQRTFIYTAGTGQK